MVQLPDGAACGVCMPGHWCSGGRAFACGENTYADMSLAVRTTQDDCIACGTNARTSHTGASSVADCGCVSGFYRSGPESAVCHPCPSGARCDRDTQTPTLLLKPGYWRVPASAGGCLNVSADVRQCPVSKTCRGTLDASGPCFPGVDPRVPYCSHCVHRDEYLDIGSGDCTSCAGPRIALLAYGVTSVLLGLCTLLFAHYAPAVWQQRLTQGVSYARSTALRASLSAKLKQALTYYQVVAHLHTVYGVVLPPSFQALQRRFDLFNLNVFALPGLRLECYGFPSFTSQLLVRATAPLLLCAGGVLYCWWRRKPADAVPFALWTTFLVFSLVSSPAFQAFNCEGFDNCRSYLRADYSMVCTDSDGDRPAYTQLKVVATLVILLYPVLIPLLYGALLFTSRGAGMAHQLGFLTANYRGAFFWWELVETAKRLLLASFFALPFMGHGTLMQLLMALVAQLVFLVLQVYAA
eukprot:582985-Prymnesium_polylepis.1